MQIIFLKFLLVLDTNFSIDSIYFFSCSRKRRAADNLVFKAEHIIIISIKEVPNSVNQETEIEIFVLDPSSTSLLPAKAFTTKDLKTVILEMKDSDLPYTLKSVDDQPKKKDNNTPNPDGSTGEGGGGSNIPIVVGAAGGVVVLIALVLAVWFYRRRRKNKKYIFLL